MRSLLLWVLGTASAVVALFATSAMSLPTPASPLYLFWFTVVVTALCAVFALALLVLGRAVRQPDLAILGSGLFAASMFPLAHGLNLPGVLVAEPNGVTSFGAWVGLPAGLVIALPALSDSFPGRTRILGSALRYSAAMILITSFVFGWFILRPDDPPAAGFDQWWTVVGAAVAFSGAQVLGYRQIRLFEIGRRPASFVAAIGFSWLGVSSLVWLIAAPNDAAIWLAHVVDASGVLLASVGLILSHRDNRDLTAVLAPVLQRDPAMALRLGITPQIHQFVSMLDEKDRNTAGHVTRVAELAMTIGERAGIRGERLRNLGLGALLHDIGKVQLPDVILKKPDRLTDEEFEVVKNHPVWGERILAIDPLLAPVAALVRSHHERVDGRGYPDGLRGDEISIDVGIIAVTDSWDAMTHTRHYRAGMSTEKARSIFEEHAGSQWPREAVRLLFETLDADSSPRGVFSDLVLDDAHTCDDAVADLVEAAMEG